MQSPTLSSIPRSVLLDKPFLSWGNSIVKFSGDRRTFPDVRRLKFLDFRVRASGILTIMCVCGYMISGVLWRKPFCLIILLQQWID